MKVLVLGGSGMVGSALCRRLDSESVEVLAPDRKKLNLLDERAVSAYLTRHTPDCIYLAAAKVGGILANDTYPAEFLQQNLAIQNHVIHHAWKCGVKKLCFLGSSCIYPRLAPQPISEDSLLTGPLESTNQWYAIAKIAGIKMCQAYRKQYGFDAISLMPTNLYGPDDNFDLQTSHVLPALIRRFHEAKEQGSASVTIWGTGTPRREFLHVDDLADAAVYLMANYSSPEIVNVGVGEDLSILELAQLVAEVVGYSGEIETDPSKPDGTPRKLLDVSRLHGLGWRHKINLREGVETTYRWFRHQVEIPDAER